MHLGYLEQKAVLWEHAVDHVFHDGLSVQQRWDRQRRLELRKSCVDHALTDALRTACQESTPGAPIVLALG